MYTLQNFYKDAVKIAWGAGAGNFYVTTKPTPSTGLLVVNPSSASKREIIKYSATGTDATGDYITVSSVSDRGLGGTTAQTHEIGEAVRMNYTAQHQQDVADAITQVATDLAVAILAGASYAKDTIYGISKLSYATDATLGTATITIASPAVITKTAHGLIAGDKVKFSTTGALPTGIVAATEYYVISAGLTSNDFRIAATLGGTAINTTGSQSGVHTLIDVSPIALAEADPRVITTAEKARIPDANTDAALDGNQAAPTTTNRFLTADNESAAGSDQSQTTQNASVETGEADATTKKNLVAQSFIPTKSKIRGVKLYKQADSGTPTGTVVLTLQADSSGSPSGTPLATCTLTLLQWRALDVGEFEALFASEYASMVPGSLYWIVADPSTSDNTNHINLGANTAGGYSSGTLKYKNTTDGWVLISGYDLYFKILEGTASEGAKTDSSGNLALPFFNPSKLPIPAFFQEITLQNVTTSGNMQGFGSNKDGSVFFAFVNGSSDLHRFERDAITGSYLNTHSLNGALSGGQKVAIVVLGIYVYLFYDAGANMGCYRYLAADLTGEQAISFSTPIAIGGSNSAVTAWTDGVFFYITHADAGTTVYKESISGTTLTQVTTTTLEATIDNMAMDIMMNDGTNIFGVSYSDPTVTIYKMSDIDGQAAPTSTTTKKVAKFGDDTQNYIGIVNIDATRCYLAAVVNVYNATAQIKERMILIPISKP